MAHQQRISVTLASATLALIVGFASPQLAFGQPNTKASGDVAVATSSDSTDPSTTPRAPGQAGYAAGVGVRTVAADGTFSWQRETRKKVYVYFRADDGVRSNRVIIPAR